MRADRLRVLHVIDSLADGGAEHNLITLLKHLPSPAYEHHVSWLYDDERLLPRLAPLVQSTFGLHTGRGWRMAPAAARLARHIRRLRPDVVSAKLIRAQLVARVAAALAGGCPVVSTWECVSYKRDMYRELGRRGPWLRRLNWLLDAATGLRDAQFVAVSREVAENNARVLRVSPERVSVIYNAFDPAKIAGINPAEREAVRRELGVADEGILLLSVGRLVEQKDHPTSIEAMAHVIKSRPGTVLAIAGDGSLREGLQQRIESLGLDCVRLLGARGDVPALLQAADLFVSSSQFEGHSVALMEALAAGLPAVLSRILSYVEVLGDSSAVRYFPVGDVAALATTIEDAIASLADLNAAARVQSRQIRDRFGPEVMAKRYDEVFRKAARRFPQVAADASPSRSIE